jgi:hypothetical protein
MKTKSNRETRKLFTTQTITMKKIFLLLSIFWVFHIQAQNVGIGNSNPIYKLDLSGRLRIRGGNDLFGSAGLLLGGIGSDSLNVKAFMGMATDTSVGFYGQVGGGWAFTMDTRTGITGIGEGTSLTKAGLVVNLKAGAVHAMFGSNSSGVALESDYPGIGLNSYYSGGRKTMTTGFSGYIGVNPQVGGMQFLVSDQSYTTGSIATYKTALDIKPNGRLGIGATDPAFIMDINGRIRLRALGATSGIWFNNSLNTQLRGFLGMMDEDAFGLYGDAGAGWGLTISTSSGNTQVHKDLNVTATSNFSGNANMNGFTRLGELSTPVKTRFLSGTTSALPAGFSDIPHGLDKSKIIAVNVLVTSLDGVDVGPGYFFNTGLLYNFQLNNSDIRITNPISPIDCGLVLSRPVKVLVTYRE